jgi:hypothetical protein
MNNDAIMSTDTNRDGIDRCDCPTCKGCAGTATVCFNSRKLAARIRLSPAGETQKNLFYSGNK